MSKGNILENHYRTPAIKVSKRNYWDLNLADNYGERLFDGSFYYDGDVLAALDLTKCNNEFMKIDTYYDGYIDNEPDMGGLWFTAMDNGSVKPEYPINQWIEKVNKVFINRYTDTTYADHGISLYPVYPDGISCGENGLHLTGGFLQGFFALSSGDYTSFPTSISGLTFNVGLIWRPDNEITSSTNLNAENPDNEGFFLTLGVKQENKMWYYGTQNYKDNFALRDFWVPAGHVIDPNTTDVYGFKLSDVKYQHYETDNKYAMFNRTYKPGTYTVDTWVEGSSISVYEPKKLDGPNKYTIFNRTPTGTTVDTWINGKTTTSDTGETVSESFDDRNIDVLGDLGSNIIGFRVDHEGHIGYRALVKDCENDEFPLKMVEEYSEKAIIPNSPYYINIEIIRGTLTDIVRIYANGRLILISKENIGYLDFRCLNEVDARQLGVPYNISIGGGSIGLRNFFVGLNETNDNGDEHVYSYILPIEKYFAGTFIGDIFDFTVTNDIFPYHIIKSNAQYKLNTMQLNSILFVKPEIYFGLVENNNVQDVSQLNKSENKLLPVSINFDGYGYICLAYSKALGLLKSIKDQNGLSYYNVNSGDFSINENEEYYFYVSDSPAMHHNMTFTFTK